MLRVWLKGLGDEVEEFATVLLVHVVLGLKFSDGLPRQFEVAVELFLDCALGQPHGIADVGQEGAPPQCLHQHKLI